MRVFTEVSVKLLGNVDKAKRLLSYSRTLLGIMKACNNKELQVQSWRRTLPDGSLIRVYSLFGRDYITIETFEEAQSVSILPYYTYGPRTSDAMSWVDDSTLSLYPAPPHNIKELEVNSLDGWAIYNGATSYLDEEDQSVGTIRPIMKNFAYDSQGGLIHWGGFSTLREYYVDSPVPNAGGVFSWEGQLTYSFGYVMDIVESGGAIYILEGSSGSIFGGFDIDLSIYTTLGDTPEREVQFNMQDNSGSLVIDGDTYVSSNNGSDFQLSSAKIAPDLSEVVLVIFARDQDNVDSGYDNNNGDVLLDEYETYEVIIALEPSGTGLAVDAVTVNYQTQNTCAFVGRFIHNYTTNNKHKWAFTEDNDWFIEPFQITRAILPANDIYGTVYDSNIHMSSYQGSTIDSILQANSPAIDIGIGNNASPIYPLNETRALNHTELSGVGTVKAYSCAYAATADTTIPAFVENDPFYPAVNIGFDITYTLLDDSTQTVTYVESVDVQYVGISYFESVGTCTSDYIWHGSSRLLVGHLYDRNPDSLTFGTRRRLEYGPTTIPHTSRRFLEEFTLRDQELWRAPNEGTSQALPTTAHTDRANAIADLNIVAQSLPSNRDGVVPAADLEIDQGLYIFITDDDSNIISKLGSEIESYGFHANDSSTFYELHGIHKDAPNLNGMQATPITLRCYRTTNSTNLLNVTEFEGEYSLLNSIFSTNNQLTTGGWHIEDSTACSTISAESTLFRASADISGGGNYPSGTNPLVTEVLAESVNSSGAAYGIVFWYEGSANLFKTGGVSGIFVDDTEYDREAGGYIPSTLTLTGNWMRPRTNRLIYATDSLEGFEAREDYYGSAIDVYPYFRSVDQARGHLVQETRGGVPARYIVGGHMYYLGAVSTVSDPFNYLTLLNENFDIVVDLSTVETENGDEAIWVSGDGNGQRSYAGLDTR